jgi:hypothetical protein
MRIKTVKIAAAPVLKEIILAKLGGKNLLSPQTKRTLVTPATLGMIPMATIPGAKKVLTPMRRLGTPMAPVQQQAARPGMEHLQVETVTVKVAVEAQHRGLIAAGKMGTVKTVTRMQNNQDCRRGRTSPSS